MQALAGGDILKLMKKRLQTAIKKAIRCCYIPRFFSTLSELSEDSDEKLFFLAGITPIM